MAEKALIAVVQDAYVQGVSARSVDDLMQRMGRSGISKSQVSRLRFEIGGKVKALLGCPIEGDCPSLWIDATYVNVHQPTKASRPPWPGGLTPVGSVAACTPCATRWRFGGKSGRRVSTFKLEAC